MDRGTFFDKVSDYSERDSVIVNGKNYIPTNYVLGLTAKLKTFEEVILPPEVALWVISFFDEGGTPWDLLHEVTHLTSKETFGRDDVLYKWLQIKGNKDLFLSAIVNGYHV